MADLLAITAVHLMRRAAVEELLECANAGWTVVRDLLEDGRLAETAYAGETYFLKNFGKSRAAQARTNGGG